MRSLHAATIALALTCGANASSLLLSSQIQYGTVIQGGVVPVYAFVYNNAPAGAPAVPYQVTGAYGVVDSVTSIGSPYITTTLGPLTNVPSNDDHSQGVPFQVNFQVPTVGEYSTTFLLHYSDERDLPGANIPGSQLGSFTVDVNVTADTAYWTITTDTVAPEPAPLALVACGAAAIGLIRRRYLRNISTICFDPR